MRLAPLEELVRTLGIRFLLPRNRTTYHYVYIIWLTCGGKLQTQSPKQLGAHYMTLQGAISSTKNLIYQRAGPSRHLRVAILQCM